MIHQLTWRKAVTSCVLVIVLSFVAAAVRADNDCKDQIADWQPRERLKQQLEQQGWVVKRIRIDDGCYEVRALDAKGRRVKATFAPASLTLLELEVKHQHQPERDPNNAHPSAPPQQSQEKLR